MKGLLHAGYYSAWLIGQLLLASRDVLVDTLTGNKKLDPSVVAYPLRVTKDWQITAFACSITITPGTISIGLDEVRQVSGCSWCTPFSAPTRWRYSRI